MNKRDFYNKLVSALRIDGYFIAHTNDDAHNNPYQVTLYDPVGNFRTNSPICFVVRCHKNMVSIYKYTYKGSLKLDDNLTLIKEVNWFGADKANMIVSTVKQLREFASELFNERVF